MDFKFLNENTRELLTFNNTLRFYQFDPNNVEFCFQFDDEEPIVFAQGPNNCNINISPTQNGSMIFNNNGRVFKIFARERND